MVHFSYNSYNSYNLTVSYNSYLRSSIFTSSKKLNGAKGYSLRVFSALWDFFPKKEFFHRRVPLQFFDIFRQNGCWKIPKGPPFSFFGIVRLFFSIYFHKRVPNSPILWHFEVLLLFLSLRYGADSGRSRLVISTRVVLSKEKEASRKKTKARS